jgi:hypothetical protein
LRCAALPTSQWCFSRCYFLSRWPMCTCHVHELVWSAMIHLLRVCIQRGKGRAQCQRGFRHWSELYPKAMMED